MTEMNTQQPMEMENKKLREEIARYLMKEQLQNKENAWYYLLEALERIAIAQERMVELLEDKNGKTKA